MNDTNRHYNEMSRRQFLRTGAAGLAAAGIAPLTYGQSKAPLKLPLRRYGRTGLEISSLVGATTWSNSLVPLAIQSGVNYWHKAQAWNDETYPPALKAQPRESYYLEVVVDRVGGNHRTGRIDEEAHYQFVKDTLKKLSVGYFDVFKFHFGYHSVDEAKTNQGMIKAFDRLKKEGLVKHLTISQHHYNDIGGDMAYDIVDHLIEHSPYEAAQFFYSYGAPPEMNQILELARKKDFGTIAMKTMRGVGRARGDNNFDAIMQDPKYKGSNPAIATVKWLMSNPNLDAAVVMMNSFQEMEEDFRAAMDASLAYHDRQVLDQFAAYNDGLTCSLCAKCVSSCSENISIADIFRYERYALDYHELNHAKREYRALSKNGSACIACGDCIPTCHANIDILSKLKDVHSLLG